MGRPKIVNPQGEVRRVSIVVSLDVLNKLHKEAKRKGVSMSALVRARIDGEAA